MKDIDLAKKGTAIEVFGIPRTDPGFVYILKSNNRYKIGRSKDPKSRLRAAKTWVPEYATIGVKPFWQHRIVERELHIGFACAWETQEWFKMPDEGYEEVVMQFQDFSNTDIDRNAIDYVYWMNSSGMAEFIIEITEQNKSRKEFLRQESKR